MTRFALVLLSVCFFSSCIFDTRTPDNPAEPSANYKPPTEPSDVFTNMTNAFADKNATNYVKSFADSVTAGRAFVFEPIQTLSNQGVFLGWNRQSEEQYFNKITFDIPLSSSSLLFNFSPPNLSAETAFFEGSYQLAIPHAKTFPQTALGHVQFYLIKDNLGNWVIWRWVDITNQQGDFSWSDVKVKFGQ
jgi:hypothetical protein